MDKSIEKLQSILEKSKNPIETLKIEVEVFGVFNLPESWKPIEGDQVEYSHTLTISKIQFPNGKVRRRELTEEEHKAQEESKKLKKDAVKKKRPRKRINCWINFIGGKKKKIAGRTEKKARWRMRKSGRIWKILFINGRYF